jgi:hypothetical protein
VSGVDPLVARLAAVLHNRAHHGWHRWFEDGRDCPDGRSDSDAWVEKALLLVSDLASEGLVLHENKGECYIGDRMLAVRAAVATAGTGGSVNEF